MIEVTAEFSNIIVSVFPSCIRSIVTSSIELSEFSGFGRSGIDLIKRSFKLPLAIAFGEIVRFRK